MTLLELREALRKATGPDRELDIELLTTLCGYRDVHGNGLIFERGTEPCRTLDGDENLMALPSPTASIDAAMTLVPEGGWHRMGTNGTTANAGFVADGHGVSEADAATIPLALCLARIEYEIAKQDAEDEGNKRRGSEPASA